MKFKDCKERYFLECLWNGLQYLRDLIVNLETKQKEKLQVDQKGRVVALHFQMSESMPEHHMVINYFIWYTNSLLSFLKLFAKAYNPKRNWRKEFSNELKWRNKVAGHTAYTDPRKDDNQYSQDMSIMMSPEWRNGTYEVGSLCVGDQGSYSHFDWDWSLNETHNKLETYLKAEM